MIRIRCPGCKTEMQAAPGLQVACVRCGQVLRVPRSTPAPQMHTRLATSEPAPIRFSCPACRSLMEAPTEKAGQKISCLKCGQRLLIPMESDCILYAEPYQSRSAPPPVPFAQVQRSVLATVLAWCCPAVLAFAILFTLAYFHAHSRMDPGLQMLVRWNQASLPTGVAVLGYLMIASMALGLCVTVVTFVVGIMKSHKLAIVLSSVTFVLAWPLLFCAGFAGSAGMH